MENGLAFEPFQIVSLLQMLDKYGLAFYRLGSLLDGMVTASMVGRNAAEMPSSLINIPQLKKIEEESQQRNKAAFEKVRARLEQEFPILRAWLERVGLTYSLKGVDYAETEVARSPSFSTIERVIDELKRRIEDELDSALFVHVATKNLGLYSNAAAFGDKVADRFSDIAFDVEHAGRCLALGEGTACVMHLMRVVEGAVSAVALGVGIPVAAVQGISSWEALLNLIRERIRDNNKSKIPSWEASRPFYESILAYLYAVKDAWRNPSMHLEKKYTDLEAQRIFNAVKSLMEHLGEHLDQSGKFTA